jgi:hypothetical protein
VWRERCLVGILGFADLYIVCLTPLFVICTSVFRLAVMLTQLKDHDFKTDEVEMCMTLCRGICLGILHRHIRRHPRTHIVFTYPT